MREQKVMQLFRSKKDVLGLSIKSPKTEDYDSLINSTEIFIYKTEHVEHTDLKLRRMISRRKQIL